jgi:hypothetical protein
MPRMARVRSVFAGAALALILGAAPASAQTVDLVGDHGFEASTAGFESSSPLDGSVSLTTENPIEGASSLHVALNAFGRASFTHQYGFQSGPRADAVTVTAKLRVDAGVPLQVCAIAYVTIDQEPRSACQGFPVDPGHVVDASVTVPLPGLQLDRVIFQVRLDTGGTVEATLDDAHAFVVPPAVDLITDNGFDFSRAGFEPFSPLDGHVSLGDSNLRVDLRPYGRVIKTHYYGYGDGPLAASVTVAGKVRVDRGRPVRVCSIAYFFLDPEPRSACQTVASGTTDVLVSVPADRRRLDRVLFELTNDGGTSHATLDDAHLFVAS